MVFSPTDEQIDEAAMRAAWRTVFGADPSRRPPGRPEAAVQREALRLFRQYGIDLRRTNAGAAMLPGRGGKLRPVRFGAPGTPDSAGCLPDGRYIACEFKRGSWTPARVRGKDRERWLLQLARLQEVNRMGGVGLWLADSAAVHGIAPRLLAGCRVEIDDDGNQWITDEPSDDPPVIRAGRSRRGRSAPQCGPVDRPPPDATYRLSLWDHEAQVWEPEWRGLTRWRLRAAIREVEGWGYSSVSYLVERE